MNLHGELRLRQGILNLPSPFFVLPIISTAPNTEIIKDLALHFGFTYTFVKDFKVNL